MELKLPYCKSNSTISAGSSCWSCIPRNRNPLHVTSHRSSSLADTTHQDTLDATAKPEIPPAKGRAEFPDEVPSPGASEASCWGGRAGNCRPSLFRSCLSICNAGCPGGQRCGCRLLWVGSCSLCPSWVSREGGGGDPSRALQLLWLGRRERCSGEAGSRC